MRGRRRRARENALARSAARELAPRGDHTSRRHSPCRAPRRAVHSMESEERARAIGIAAHSLTSSLRGVSRPWRLHGRRLISARVIRLIQREGAGQGRVAGAG